MTVPDEWPAQDRLDRQSMTYRLAAVTHFNEIFIKAHSARFKIDTDTFKTQPKYKFFWVARFQLCSLPQFPVRTGKLLKLTCIQEGKTMSKNKKRNK